MSSLRDRDGTLPFARFSLEAALEVGEAFGLSRAKLGLTAPQRDRMASAFEHEDLARALEA